MASQESITAKDPRRRLGDRGEDIASAFFTEKGFHVLGRNWSCRWGEIDLICQKNGVIHFVEIKTRRGREFGYPEESITKTKLRHLSRAIETYLQRSNRRITDYQMDALAITISSDRPPEFHYIENIACG
jgi:putative endonuclease